MSKKLRFVIFALVLLVLGAGIFFFSNREENITLSISEKKWIENNKNKLIDLSVLNDAPIVNNNGLGILFDFLSSQDFCFPLFDDLSIPLYKKKRVILVVIFIVFTKEKC